MKLQTSCGCGRNCACKNCRCSARARFFDALGNETRLYILDEIRTGPKSVSQLVQRTHLEQTQVSHALKQLERSGLATSTRKGKFRFYAANRTMVEPLMKLIGTHVRTYRDALVRPCCCGEERP